MFGDPIPVTLTPGVWVQFDNRLAVNGTPAQRHRTLIVGLRSGGTQPPLTAVPVTAPQQGGTFYGRGSMAAHMVDAALKAQPNNEVWAMGVSEADAGVKATATITVTGPATADGTLSFIWGGRRRVVAVAAGDTAIEIAAAIDAADDVDLDSATTSTSADEVVTVSARHKGAYGNALVIEQNWYHGEVTPAGVGLTITAFANGATDPDLATVVEALGDTQYHTLITGLVGSANLTELHTEFLARADALRAIEGLVVGGMRGDYAATLAFGAALNSPVTSIVASGLSPHPPWVWAAVYGAVLAAYAAVDPAVPLQYSVLARLLAPKPEVQWKRVERDQLLAVGMSTVLVSDTGDVTIERAVTTYTTNAQALPDPSYRNVETVRTLYWLRYSFRIRMFARYAKAKVADDDTNFAPGQVVATPLGVRAEVIALYQEWELAGLVENVARFKELLIVRRDPDDPDRMLVFHPPDLINQLRVIAATMAFTL